MVARKPERQANCTSAFTLIESLGVIAIIASLAALVLPALAKAKAKARSANCISNIRQLSLVAHVFAEEPDQAVAWAERNWAAPFNQGFNFTNPATSPISPSRFKVSGSWLQSTGRFNLENAPANFRPDFAAFRPQTREHHPARTRTKSNQT